MNTAFISGHLALTDQEFEEHYAPRIKEAFERGDHFVVGDAPGTDKMAQEFLYRLSLEFGHSDNVTIYHMFEMPRHNVANARTTGGFTSDNARDAAMTEASDYDIAWVRPGRENSGTARNIKRRTKGKS